MTDREKVTAALEKALAATKAVNGDFVILTVREGKQALELLKGQQQIVRCKDCRYLNEDSEICVIGIMHGYRDTWFCADGERR